MVIGNSITKKPTLANNIVTNSIDVASKSNEGLVKIVEHSGEFVRQMHSITQMDLSPWNELSVIQ